MRNRIAAAVVALLLTAPVAAPAARADEVIDGPGGPQVKESSQTPLPRPTPEKKPATPPEKPPVAPPEQPVGKPDRAPERPNPVKEPLKSVPNREPLDPAPATQPSGATASAGESEFPTPAELIKRMQARRAAKAKQSKVVHFDLADPIAEKPADFSLFGDPSATTLRSLVERMHLARDDKDVRGVVLTLGDPSLNLAQAQELRNALVELRKAGKKTFVYADGYDTVSYTVASGATDVCMMEGGEIMIPGVGMEATFYKGLLDKVGVQADYVQIGEYKGADEQYTRTGPSEQLRGELNKLADSMYEQIIDGIATSRNLPSDAVKQMIDETIVPAKAAKDRGFVDHLVDMDGLRALMSSELGNDSGVDIVANYGKAEKEELDFSSPFALLSSLAKKPEASNKPAVALIYAEGTIVDGDGGEGLLSGGGNIGSTTIRKALRKAATDANVKAIVIRIDSPGGSAQASEVMWQAARTAAGKKPVIISVGSMAASGGYYLASAGDHIFADPSAIVGSIGVVGGKFVFKDLYGKLGVNNEAFGRGRNADLFSTSKPFDERQRRLITNWMKGTYEQFTQRVMTTRKGKIKDIDQVAKGRIFIARQAKELGMVDEIGGVEDALAYAAEKVNLKRGDYDVKLLPTPRTLADLITGAGGGAEASLPFRPKLEIGELAALKALDPTMRKALGQQLQMINLLQQRPVVLVAPFVVTVR
jgi:protease-4